MGKIQEGQKLDFSFETPFEKGVTLQQYMAGKPVAVVFLRYYGCTLCQYDIGRYAEEYEQIQTAGGKLLVVLQSDPALLKEELGGQDALPFAIACDPEKQLYQEYEIWPAESKAKMISPKGVLKIAKAKSEGYAHGRYEGDELQLPAAFVVKTDGVVAWAHYAETVDDVPDAATLAGVMEQWI